MSFLTPWFLAGLLGVSIPVLLHLIRRDKAIRIPFSAVRFLKKAPRRMIWFQRLQQVLLLLLRAVIVALLALAFARPYLTGMISELAGMEPRSLVLLLDQSMSMRYGGAFERAQDAALERIRGLQEGDEVAIVTFADVTGVVLDFTTNHGDAEQFVRSLDAPGFASTRYLPPLQLGNQLLSTARYSDKTVVLITDFRRQGFSGMDHHWRMEPGVEFETVSVGDENAANIIVSDIKAPAQLVRDRETHVVLARIRNVGNRPESSVQVTLRMNEKTRETRTVDLSGQTEAVVEFPVVFDERGIHRGVVEVDDSAFPDDNRRYFTVNVLPPVRILCVNGETGADWYDDESYWFRLAMGKPGESPYLIDVRRPEQLRVEELARYHVLAFLNVDHAGAIDAGVLQQFVESGGSVILAPADRVSAGRFNETFGNVSPARLQAPARLEDGAFLILAEINARHPVIQPLRASGRSDFGTAEFQSYWTVERSEGAELILGFDNGQPALLERSAGRGRVLLFTSSLDTEWNNLPLQVLYLPLLHEIAGYLTLRSDHKQDYAVGEAFPLLSQRGAPVMVSVPDEPDQTLTGEAGEQRFFNGTNTPGFYSQRSGDTELCMAVNTSAEESDMTVIAPSEIREAVIDPGAPAMVSHEVRTAAVLERYEETQQLWWWLLLAVLLLGLGETLLANRTYR